MSNIPDSTLILLNEYEVQFNKISKLSQSNKIYPNHENLIIDFKSITTCEQADDFFSKYGVGNYILDTQQPFERQNAYELLLEILYSIDSTKFKNIHKGTPYYFIGWTAFQNGNFAKAIFYFDSAISEDVYFRKEKTYKLPAHKFFLLDNSSTSFAEKIHKELRQTISKTIKHYNAESGSNITIDNFRENFLIEMLYSDSQKRSLLTALYTFLLEYKENEKQVKLKTENGGSIQSFLDHLFDGARILESLLEIRGGEGNTLYPKITKSDKINVSKSALKSNQTLKDAEIEYYEQLTKGGSFQDCNFASAYIIRNTTGHSLLWSDQFTNSQSYLNLYRHLINSIFWSIDKLWLSK